MWNHNPDNTKWSIDNGLTLRTATASVLLDHSAMRDGDRAGLALLRDSSAWIGAKRDGGKTGVVMVNRLTTDGNWNTTGTGPEVASAPVSGNRIRLRASADIRFGTARSGTFSYSTDSTTFTRLGSAFSMGNVTRFELSTP